MANRWGTAEDNDFSERRAQNIRARDAQWNAQQAAKRTKFESGQREKADSLATQNFARQRHNAPETPQEQESAPHLNGGTDPGNEPNGGP